MHRPLALTMSLPLASGAPGSLAAQTDAAAGVRRVLETYAEFLQAKNVAGMETLVADDEWVHIIEGVGANHGWEDYREHHLKPELAESENFRYRYFAIEPQVRDGMAWAPFRYELSVDMRGQYIAMDGRGTAVLEKRSGRWVIVHLLLPFPPRNGEFRVDPRMDCRHRSCRFPYCESARMPLMGVVRWEREQEESAAKKRALSGRIDFSRACENTAPRGGRRQ